MVLGTLAQQLLYPTWTEELSCTPDTTKSAGSLPFLVRPAQVDSAKIKSQKPMTDELIQVLKDVRIENILSRFSLDSTCEWSSVLSLGEQQRLAFARLLLSKPYLVLLDESTSALDEANEEHLYKQIEAAGITYISVGHRTSLYKHHNKRLRISTADPDSDQQNWFIEPIIEETMPSTTNL